MNIKRLKTKDVMFLIFVSCFVFYILLWFAQFFGSFTFLARSVDQIVKFSPIDWLISSRKNVFKFLCYHWPRFWFQSEIFVMFQLTVLVCQLIQLIFSTHLIDQTVQFSSINWLISNCKNVCKCLYYHWLSFWFQSKIFVMF